MTSQIVGWSNLAKKIFLMKIWCTINCDRSSCGYKNSQDAGVLIGTLNKDIKINNNQINGNPTMLTE